MGRKQILVVEFGKELKNYKNNILHSFLPFKKKADKKWMK